ncbi:polyphosphate kinase 2 family protein [Williamsia maris]|uniref:Polyphosphate:nucleotide phosphotransferase, PPK2 family n=1 Tax=Williamsia maris TaxID=72806 RepID=A0ABT1HEI7_9NOCA|nr:polyphosphate kinase 2 family protein [Williamsia maris]MCP2175276.1 polyphosphate:nucleotide phosphotransferase, PPK2 family [Williamsia maris]
MSKTKDLGSSKKPDRIRSSTLRPETLGRLDTIDTRAKPGFDGSKSDGAKLLTKRGERLAGLQELLYAGGRSGDTRSVLLVLQGMDTSGKGGIVRHVMGMVDPQGVSHASFGKPTDEELEHDFLWRIKKKLPDPGQIGVFDRSHYEDVLVVRVHDLVPMPVWQKRYEEINAFERELVDAGTTVVKAMLHISPDAQRERLAKRLDRPDKYWKFNPADIDERAYWSGYQEAYQAMLEETDTDVAPWHVVPADRKWYARLAITELVIDALEAMDLGWPDPDFDVEHEKKRLAES